jgi:hypothetical protein
VRSASDQKWYEQKITALPAADDRMPCAEFSVLTPANTVGVQDLGADPKVPGSAHHYRFRAGAYRLLAASMLYSPQPLVALHGDDQQTTADLSTDSAGRPLSYSVAKVRFTDPSGSTDSMDLEETYSSFGTVVTETAPDPSQVTDQLNNGDTIAAPPDPND